jgi:hypothetical protein
MVRNREYGVFLGKILLYRHPLYIWMSDPLKNKLSANAKHFRLLSRAETFQRNRKSVEELDYLKYYSPQQREAVLRSLEAPMPTPIPQIAPDTISFYRRSNQPVYRTKYG